MKDRLICAGLKVFRATGLDRAVSFVTRGRGAILMFHRIRCADGRVFSPNKALEVTPEFLDESISLLDELGYEIAPIGELRDRLARDDGRRFAVLTFDDGYRDNLTVAAPILRKRSAPYTIYVTTGFMDGTARPWWLDLEAAVSALDHIEMEIAGDAFSAPARSAEEKQAAYAGAFAFLRMHDEVAMLEQIAMLVDRSGGGGAGDVCMNWDEVRAAASDPLCTIGVHTLSHARLAKRAAEDVRRELQQSRAIIEREIGGSALHLAYPFGDKGSAGLREFQIARACGFETAVTTRPGVLLSGHRDHLTALPRIAVHGSWPDKRSLETFVSGAPSALWNFGRLDVR